jgi:hypothetical protein
MMKIEMSEEGQKNIRDIIQQMYDQDFERYFPVTKESARKIIARSKAEISAHTSRMEACEVALGLMEIMDIFGWKFWEMPVFKDGEEVDQITWVGTVDQFKVELKALGLDDNEIQGYLDC